MTELVRSFKVMPEILQEEFVDELEEAANPVKLAAQAKAPTTMSGMGNPKSEPWTQMRIGIAKRNPAHVWVAPQLRGGRLRKQREIQKETFVNRMQSRALDPALKENEDKVRERVEDLLDRIGRKEGF